jgi:hypothetical protein
MDQRLLSRLRMKTLRCALLGALISSLAACGGAEDGSGSDMAEASCPLDASARVEVEQILADALLDASWITIQSPGYAAPVERAFGAQIPFADVPARYVATLIKPCSGAKTLPPYCDRHEDVVAIMACRQFACEADGTLVASVSLGPLPASMPVSPPPGDVVVSAFDHATRFHSVNDTAMSIAWRTEMGLQLGPERHIEIDTEGSSEVDGYMTMGVHTDVRVEGLGTGSFTATADADGTSTFGMGSVDGVPVVVFDDFGSTWIGSCTSR